MKTGIEHMSVQFEAMAKSVEEWLEEVNNVSLEMSIQIINYLEGIAFAALIAHKERESDIEIANRMYGKTKCLREDYNNARREHIGL